MPDCSDRVRIGDVDYESRADGPWNVLVNGQPLTSTVNEYVQLSKVFVADAFDKDSKEIRFVSQIETICFTVFNTIKQIKQNNGSEVTGSFVSQSSIRILYGILDWVITQRIRCYRNTIMEKCLGNYKQLGDR